LVVGGLAIGVTFVALAQEASAEHATTRANDTARRATALAARLDAALRTYGANREPEATWFARTAALVTELQEQSQTLDALLPGLASAPRRRVAEILPTLSETLDRARANAEASRTLMALDVIDTNGLPASESLLQELDRVTAEADAGLGAAQRRWRWLAGGALATWALAWAFGMVGLWHRAHGVAPPATQTTTATTVRLPANPAAVGVPQLSAVAVVCEAIGQLRQDAELPGVMEAAARVLGASGVVLWIPSGDTLVVATFHGYSAGLGERMGPVPLGQGNLLTQSWHTQQPTFAAAAPGGRAALVTPILGASSRAAGLLAAEFDSSPDAGEDVVAAARLLAAQLGAVLAAPTPADSTTAFSADAGQKRASA
jgi:hypothetical protein